jgi:hypothetical protein
MDFASAKQVRGRAPIPASQLSIVNPMNFCAFCGHVLSEDMTVEQRAGVSVMFCPAERIRFTYSVWTRRMEVKLLAS